LASLSGTQYSAYDIQLVAFDPRTDFTVTPWMKESLNRPLGKDEVVVGNDISSQLGEKLVFYGHFFTVAGKLESTGTGLDRLVFMSFDDAYVMAEESYIPHRGGVAGQKALVVEPNIISAVLVKIEKGIFPDIVASRIKRLVGAVTVVTAAQLLITLESHLSSLLGSMLLITATLWIASTMLIGVVFWMAVNERRREIGLLRAIGATGRFVFKMVLTESTLLTFIGGLLGIIGGGVVIYSFSLLISKSLDVPYLWPTFIQLGHMIGISLGIAVLTGLVASFIPALVSSRMEPLHAIRTEQ
jgi:putative ABC transport system permease protein